MSKDKQVNVLIKVQIFSISSPNFWQATERADPSDNIEIVQLFALPTRQIQFYVPLLEVPNVPHLNVSPF